MVRRSVDAGRYPSVNTAAGCPTRGPPYDPDPRCVRHPTLNLRLFLFIYFFLHKNNRCFFELVISFIDGSSCKYLSFVILSAFDNCLLKLAPLTSLICLTQNGSDQMKICCIIHPTEHAASFTLQNSEIRLSLVGEEGYDISSSLADFLELKQMCLLLFPPYLLPWCYIEDIDIVFLQGGGF